MIVIELLKNIELSKLKNKKININNKGMYLILNNLLIKTS